MTASVQSQVSSQFAVGKREKEGQVSQPTQAGGPNLSLATSEAGDINSTTAKTVHVKEVAEEHKTVSPHSPPPSGPESEEIFHDAMSTTHVAPQVEEQTTILLYKATLLL